MCFSVKETLCVKTATRHLPLSWKKDKKVENFKE